jgi:hypothetical protein
MVDKETAKFQCSVRTEMENRKNIIIIILSLLLVAGIGYYYFVATLSLTQIVGKTDSAIANASLALFDFDTGLTRYDIYRLKEKAPYWQKRIETIRSIRNADEQAKENAQLIEEMLNDPSMKKIANKFGVGGLRNIYSIVTSLQS